MSSVPKLISILNMLLVILLGGLLLTVIAEESKESKSKEEQLAGAPNVHKEGTKKLGPQTTDLTTKAKYLKGKDLIAKDPYGHYIDTKLDVGFFHAFVASLSVIIVSELGDKTFFIAAIMAMRHSRLTVFGAAMAALGLMTVLSALLGAATTVIPRWFTYYASSALFAVFGLKMLREGYGMSPDEGMEELEEVQEDIKKRESEMERQQTTQDVETGIIRTRRPSFFNKFVSQIFLEAFTLTFLAEWGDRSQISTIILAAREEVIGVILGGTIGHALCTGLAVLGGRYVATKISIRTVTLVGGVVFIIFALSAFFIDLES